MAKTECIKYLNLPKNISTKIDTAKYDEVADNHLKWANGVAKIVEGKYGKDASDLFLAFTTCTEYFVLFGVGGDVDRKLIEQQVKASSARQDVSFLEQDVTKNVLAPLRESVTAVGLAARYALSAKKLFHDDLGKFKKVQGILNNLSSKLLTNLKNDVYCGLKSIESLEKDWKAAAKKENKKANFDYMFSKLQNEYNKRIKISAPLAQAKLEK